MEQCWDADPLKRPDHYILSRKIINLHLSFQNMPNESFQSETNDDNLETSYTSCKLFSTSKVYQFENLPEPRNATEGMII